MRISRITGSATTRGNSQYTIAAQLPAQIDAAMTAIESGKRPLPNAPSDPSGGGRLLPAACFQQQGVPQHGGVPPAKAPVSASTGGTHG